MGPKYKLVKSIARGQMRLVVLVLEAAQVRPFIRRLKIGGLGSLKREASLISC